MPEPIDPLLHARKSGDEPFNTSGKATNTTLIAFWQWAVSDLAANVTRGRLAEFIVASALGVENEQRVEWAPFDLRSQKKTPIEIKSCAYIQSWAQKKPSNITFNVQKKRLYEIETNTHAAEPGRPALIYIFALLAHPHRETLDPLDLDQWHFYPLLTEVLNQRLRSQHSISLNSLKKLTNMVTYSELKAAVEVLEQSLSSNS